MTLRFVKTSILTSEDGIDFGKETAVESEEIRAARLAAEQAQNKPLYQQLADIKSKQDEEYAENTKKMFAPPKALDADDVGYFEELDNIKARAMSAREEREKKELTAFRAAQKVDRSDVNDSLKVPVNLPQYVEKKTIIPTIIVRKKKIIDGSKGNESLAQGHKHKLDQNNEEENKRTKIDSMPTTVAVNNDSSSSIINTTDPVMGLSSLVDYGSDSE